MEFVELTISPTKRYTYKTASNIEMNILGDFLASDVGYRPAPVSYTHLTLPTIYSV